MADFFVRKTGSDAAAGTSAGAAWLTIGKGLGAAGISSGDRLIVGAGVYREQVTVAMTSATVTTSVIGDVDGALTGDAGEVQWTAQTVDDFVTAGIACVDLAGRDFLSFQKIVFVGGATNPGCVIGTTATSTDVTFTDCAFIATPSTPNMISHTSAAGAASNWTFTRCLFPCAARNATSGTVLLTLNRHTVDYDANIGFTNCVFGGGPTSAIRVASTGAGVGFGGGVDVANCSFLMVQTAFQTGDANLATTIPCTFNNCFVFAGTGVNASAAGQITENFNVFSCVTARTNVTAGAQSVTTYAPLFHFGQELIWGGQLRPLGMPTAGSPLLGFGATGAPSVDILNRNRPSGMRLVASGTATAGAARTLTDSGATWGVNAWAGYTLLITGGTGSGQSKSIASNTGTVITVDGNWQTNPDATSTYQVYWGDPSSTGKATAGSTTTLTDSNAAWGVNAWTGYTLHIDAGTGSGQSLIVVSNTATAITFAVATAPDSTSTYSLYKATSITTQDYAAGAYERHDHFQKETTTTDAGGVGLRVSGSGDQEIKIPVTATSTTISVKVRWHSTAVNKPQATLLANGEIGVTTETKTATGAVDTWEVLTFTPQTPTASGVVTVRLIARPDASTDLTYNDTLAVS